MSKKILVVTGATSGIGLEMTRVLATKGYKVVMACRNLDKAKRVKKEITSSMGNDCDLDLLEVDMSSFDSIYKFADKYQSKYDRLDVLLNNAGVFCDTLQWTKDGFEMTIGVNYLGPFLMTRLLLPVIKETAKARIINITSKAAFYGKLKLNENIFKSKVHGFKAYSASKLAQIHFTIDLTVSPEVEGVTGKMFYYKDIIDYNEACLDESVREGLIKLSYNTFESTSYIF